MIAAMLLAGAIAQPLGLSGAACRVNEPGPALVVTVAGLKDREGTLRVELYPANEEDFLADDTALIRARKPFRRLVARVPKTGEAELCIRAPEPRAYAVVVLHDRDADMKFSPLSDGVGLPGNPKLRLSRPKAAQASVQVGPGVSRIRVLLNYRNGLSFRPIASQ